MFAKTKRLFALVGVVGTFAVAARYLYTDPALRRLPKAKQRSLNGITTIVNVQRDHAALKRMANYRDWEGMYSRL